MIHSNQPLNEKAQDVQFLLWEEFVNYIVNALMSKLILWSSSLEVGISLPSVHIFVRKKVQYDLYIKLNFANVFTNYFYNQNLIFYHP